MKTVFMMLMLSTMNVFAAGTTAATSETKLSTEAAQVQPNGFIPYLGVNGGYTGTDSSAPVEGAPVSIKVLGSYYLVSPIVFDLGVGMANQQFSNKAAVDTAKSATVFEAASRYVFANRWQAGLVFNQFADQGRNYGASQADAQFLGLQALREFNLNENTLARLGGRIQTLTNNTGTAVNMFMVDFQMGYDFNAKKQSVAPVAAVVTAPAKPVQALAPSRPANEISLIELSQATAPKFAPAKSTISASAKSRLAKIAKVLKSNPGLVGQIEVQGRADSTGKVEANQKLSEKRALAVKQYLKSQGVKIDVVAAGMGVEGTSKNADSRRADLIFKDVKNQDALKKALSAIQ